MHGDFMEDYYKNLADVFEPIGQTVGTKTAIKSQELARKTEEKLARLGDYNQGANLSSGFSLTDQNTMESNKNKIWNDMSAANVQDMISDAASKYQIYKEGDKWYQGTGDYRTEYTGDFKDTRRAYMYGTKDDPNAVKFGLARGDLPSSDYRYQPGKAEAEGYDVGKKGYGWDSGKGGVDVNKNYMDMVLPYNVATALEAAMHGRKDALANRQYPDYMSDEAIQHASGVSEYYLNPEGLLGDTSKLTKEELEAGDTNLLEQYKNLPGAQNPYAKEEEIPDYNMARGFASNTLNVGAKLVSLIGEGLETIGEKDKSFLENQQKYLDKYHKGEKVSEWRRNLLDGLQEFGTSLQKEMTDFQRKGGADKITGYSQRDVQALSAEIDSTIKNEGWISALGKAVTDVRSLEVLVNSVPEMVALAASVGGMAIANVNNNINIGEAELGRAYTSREKVLSAASSIVGTYIDRVGDKLALSGINPAKVGLKKAVDEAPAAVKNALTSKYGKAITTIGEAPLRLAGAGAIEGATEKAQTLLETAAQRPEVFKEGFTEAEKAESDVAGVLGFAMGTHMAGPRVTVGLGAKVLRGPDREAQLKKMEEFTAKTVNEAKTNMTDTLDMEGTIDLNNREVEVEKILGVDSIARMYNDSKSVDEMIQKMDEAKATILSEVFEYNPDTTLITGVKDPNKIEAVNEWLDTYGEFQADKDGNIPQGIQDEIQYFKDKAVEFAGEPVAKTVDEAKLDKVIDKTAESINKGMGDVTTLTTEELDTRITTEVDNVLKTYGLDKTAPQMREPLLKKVRDTYNISGMSGLGNNINIGIDPEILAQQAVETAGIKNADSRHVPKQDRVVEIGSVSNADINTMMSGEGNILDSAHPNTKLRERVVRKLDPTETKNVTSTLAKTSTQMDYAIAKNTEEAGKYLKGGDTTGNMKRLMVLAINRINGQVASDTDLRSRTDRDDSMIQKNEYWAGLNNVMEQIGKDYATSYGLKLTGDNVKLAKAHRDLGRFAIKMLQDADLVETSQDTIWSVAGATVDKEGSPISVVNTKGINISKAKDSLTGNDMALVQDMGIRLKDTGAKVNTDVTDTVEIGYKSNVGDAVKRVAKMLLPNAERVPSTVYRKELLKVDPDTHLSEGTKKAIKDRMKKPIKMKSTKSIKKVMNYLKGLNDSTDGGIGAVVDRSETLKVFLKLEESGSELLAVSDSGSTMGKLDNLIGILDNLDTLQNENGFYYTFQVDSNNRLTVRESVANYQSDKVYSRSLVGIGEYAIFKQNEKDILIESILDELATKSELDAIKDGAATKEDVLAKYAKALDTIEEIAAPIRGQSDTKAFIDVLANTMLPGKKLAHLRSLGGIRALSALEAARNVRDAKGGTIVTEYIPEKDASASGVFNTTINLAGRKPNWFKRRLLQLGVKFGKEEYTEKETVNAYNILGNLIKDLTDKSKNIPEGYGDITGGDGLKAVSKIKDTLNDPKLMRNLAKYPIMTWFYSAEKKSIVENLTNEMTQVLVEKAIDGNESVLDYLSDVMGREITYENVKKIKKGDKDHRALRAELNKIGEVYYSKLNEAFPEVEAAKKELVGYFKYLVDNSKINGNDYWNGRIRTAIGVINGTEDTISLYKWKNQAVSMSPQEKIDAGLTTKDESVGLITIREKMPNETSLMALFAHNIDAAQAILGQAGINSDKGTLSIHDGFRGRPKDLVDFQTTAEAVTKEIAVKYDFVNEMAVAMKTTAAAMRADINEKNKPEVNAELERAASNLETKAAKIEELNNPRIEAKAELLKDAETRLFGKTGYVNKDEKNEDKLEAKIKPVEEIREKEVAKVYRSILDMIEELKPAFDVRRVEILANHSDENKLVSLTDEKVKELVAANKDNKALIEWLESGNSFSHNGVAYIGKKTMQGIDEVSGKKATAQQVLDTVLHEIEHSVSDGFISKEYDGKIKLEYKKMEAILDRIVGKPLPNNISPRAKQRLGYVMKYVNEGNKMQAIKELVAISREDTVAAEVLTGVNRMADVKQNIVEKLISSIWTKIQNMISNTPLETLLADDKLDAYSLGIAIQSIQNKSRTEGIGKVENATIQEDSISKYTDNISKIC